MHNSLFQRVHPHFPIFLAPAPGPPRRAVFYCPGRVALAGAEQARGLAEQWQAGGASEDPLGQELEAQAREALAAHQAWQEEPFQPVCLTVYLSNQCNLACEYCYARPRRGRGAGEVISLEHALAGARLVADNCARTGQPFRLVLHGGGEPTVHWDLLQALVAETQDLAAGKGLEWWGYVATNGVMPPGQAAWLGGNLSLVGLSCDGPPDLHDAQRPLAGGGASSPAVVRTAQAILAAGGQMSARATLTPSGLPRLKEIVAYVRGLGVGSARVEPAYGLWQPGPWAASQAASLVEGFLAAQDLARDLDLDLTMSGVRLDELHGPYCQVLRQTLHLLPDGSASACFFCADGDQARQRGKVIGGPGPGGEFWLDDAAIKRHRQAAGRMPGPCASCLAGWHCARSCPEVCQVRPGPSSHNDAPGFRCLVQRGLAQAWVLGAANMADREPEPPAPARPPAKGDSIRRRAARFLAPVKGLVDEGAILGQLEALQTRFQLEERGLPRPPWAQGEFDLTGPRAWERLAGLPTPPVEPAPLSVYVHIPFCRRRCAFCDCHSINPTPAARPRVEAHLLDRLMQDLGHYAALPVVAGRPVTTLHLGGGTPNCLEPGIVARLVKALHEHLAITPATELALESTADLLTPEHLDWLAGLGFTRLHVGVQTLAPALRKALGRRREPKAVLEALALARAQGWVVSVDMLYGLPGQGPEQLLDHLDRLIQAGAQGFSLYELQHSPRNRALSRQKGLTRRDAWENYLLFQCGHAFLRARGFAPNHITHLALPADQNLYYNHARRGEDLLALGPSADGVLGGQIYRHPPLPAYWRLDSQGHPPLQGVMDHSRSGLGLASLSRDLMTARISSPRKALLDKAGLGRPWQRAGMLCRQGDHWEVTANGSWCMATLLNEVGRLI